MLCQVDLCAFYVLYVLKKPYVGKKSLSPTEVSSDALVMRSTFAPSFHFQNPFPP